MKIYSKMFEKGIKCGGCNWSVVVLYSFDTLDVNKEGLCANCFMDMLVAGNYEINKMREHKNVIL